MKPCSSINFGARWGQAVEVREEAAFSEVVDAI
jgi:hypothetical protein